MCLECLVAHASQTLFFMTAFWKSALIRGTKQRLPSRYFALIVGPATNCRAIQTAYFSSLSSAVCIEKSAMSSAACTQWSTIIMQCMIGTTSLQYSTTER